MALARSPDRNPGTRVDVITSCLRSTVETNFVLRHSQWDGHTDDQLCPLMCAPVHPRARPFIGHSLDTERRIYNKPLKPLALQRGLEAMFSP
jgi:hypothetical protein